MVLPKCSLCVDIVLPLDVLIGHVENRMISCKDVKFIMPRELTEGEELIIFRIFFKFIKIFLEDMYVEYYYVCFILYDSQNYLFTHGS